MTFRCVNLRTGRHIGDCTLPVGRYDPHGTEHMFGDTTYVLQSTYVGEEEGTMYFMPKE